VKRYNDYYGWLNARSFRVKNAASTSTPKQWNGSVKKRIVLCQSGLNMVLI
jgi:hypothetical protein